MRILYQEGKKKISGQETRRHPETPPYRCFLSDLTGFAGLRRAGPTRTGASIPDVEGDVNGSSAHHPCPAAVSTQWGMPFGENQPNWFGVSLIISV